VPRGLAIFLALFLAYGWFYQAGGWNQNSRLDLVRAIVEKHTLRIDAYHKNTGDKAHRGKHFYSDKAPGLALAAVPVAAVVSPLLPADEEARVAWLSYLCTLATCALPMALAGWLLFLLAVRLGATPGGATFAALVFGLATPAWTYATIFFGHPLATGLLLAAFYAAVKQEGEGSMRLAFGLGLAAGWATITEYPSAPVAAIVSGLALMNLAGWRARVRVGTAILAGGGVALAVLVIYNLAAFGSALSTGYTHVEGFGGMKTGFMGVTYPKLKVLGAITFGSFRGLFFHAPVLLAGFVGLAIWRRQRAAVAALVIVAYYLLFNAAYHYWNGGWSYGPRHVAPALPFLALGLAPLWSKGTPALKALLGALALLSFVLTLAAVSTTAQPPEMFARPIAQLHWPAFVDGDLSLNHQSFLEPSSDFRHLRDGKFAHDAWNLGEKMGLGGHLSLLPLAGLFALLAIVASRQRSSR
jgi:hypothetical protein